jgi:hypothetical protein
MWEAHPVMKKVRKRVREKVFEWGSDDQLKSVKITPPPPTAEEKFWLFKI